MMDYVEPMFWSNAALMWVILVVPYIASPFNPPGSKSWWFWGTAVAVAGVAVLLWRRQPRRWEEEIRKKMASLRLEYVGHDEPPVEELRGMAYEDVERRARGVEKFTCILFAFVLVMGVIGLMMMYEDISF